MQLDTTSTCDDAGTYCCALLPPCEQLGGTCTAVPGGSSCANGALQGDCEDSGVCCAMPTEGGSFEAQAADAPEDAPPLGSCNAAPCASECTCEPSGTDDGGGVCDCGTTEAGVDGESEADSRGGSDAQSQDATVDAVAIDGPAPDAYSGVEASASGDAAMDGGGADAADADTATDAASDAAGSCGVILCASTCACVSPQTSACVCP